MISRRAAKKIAEVYQKKFISAHWSAGANTGFGRVGGGWRYTFYALQLYDFLYEYEFDAWFLNNIKKLERTTQRDLTEFIMRLHTGESVASVTPDWTTPQREAFGQELLRALAQSVIHNRINHTEENDSDEAEDVDSMRATLELEGYVYKDGILYVPEESVFDVEEEQGILNQLIDANDLKDPATLKHHLELSGSHYVDGKWDDSISNARKVLEGVLQQVADKHSSVATGSAMSQKTFDSAVRVREYLEQNGLIESKEKEAVTKIYGLLSDTGGHPYIAEKDQARLMRHLALTISQFVLLRLQGYLHRS